MYLSFIDVLGTKNNAENENFQAYMKMIIDFQNVLSFTAQVLEGNGEIHMFSDCAYIQCSRLDLMLDYLSRVRNELLQYHTFIRGALIPGRLGCVKGTETLADISKTYDDDKFIEAYYKSIKSTIKYRGTTVHGPIFLSKDISQVYYHENTIKAASIFIDPSLQEAGGKRVVRSGYVADIAKSTYVEFFDIAYSPETVDDIFVDQLFHQYGIANSSDISFGRYYLGVVITVINSSDFSALTYDEEASEFGNGPVIFYELLGIRKKRRSFYENTKWLEFAFFSLLNKLYLDQGTPNSITKEVTRQVFGFTKYMSVYRNKLHQVLRPFMKSKVKQDFLYDFHELMKENRL